MYIRTVSRELYDARKHFVRIVYYDFYKMNVVNGKKTPPYSYTLVDVTFRNIIR